MRKSPWTRMLWTWAIIGGVDIAVCVVATAVGWIITGDFVILLGITGIIGLVMLGAVGIGVLILSRVKEPGIRRVRSYQDSDL